MKSDKENELNRRQAIARLPLICYRTWSPHQQIVILDLVDMGDRRHTGDFSERGIRGTVSGNKGPGSRHRM